MLNNVYITGFLSICDDNFENLSTINNKRKQLENTSIAFKNSKYSELLNNEGISSTSKYSIIATMELLDKIKLNNKMGKKGGLVFGSEFGCINEQIMYSMEYRANGIFGIDPVLFTKTTANAPAGLAAIESNLQGINLSMVGDLMSSINAIGYSLDYLKHSDDLEFIICGGYDFYSPFLIDIQHSRKINHSFLDRISLIALEKESLICERNIVPPLATITGYKIAKITNENDRNIFFDNFFNQIQLSSSEITNVILCCEKNESSVNEEIYFLKNQFNKANIINLPMIMGWSGSTMLPLSICYVLHNKDIFDESKKIIIMLSDIKGNIGLMAIQPKVI